MKKIEVFEGNELKDYPDAYKVDEAKCYFYGSGADGRDIYLPLDENLLSRHLMLLGGIGTGKTNTFNQLVLQLRRNMTQNDVMVIFDTKGDFYKTFYRPGDIVISNDNTATGSDGPDYWNIFNEIECDEHMEENIVEIAKSLFHQKLEKTNQPFFPTAAKDLFSAILTHFSRNKELKQNNAALRAFLDSSPNQAIRDILDTHDDLRAMKNYIFDDRDRKSVV